MPSPLREPKSLPEWLELDYYRSPRPLRRLRFWAVTLVFAGCLLAVAVAFFIPRNELALQAGPLAPAHASFNADCAVCHTEAFGGARRLLPTNHNVPSVNDAACSTCHAGPVHHAQQTSQTACATCHREHRGQVLTHVADGHCTNCHGNLARKDGATSAFGNVTSFAADHPEFKLFRDGTPKDPGTIRFNHQKHFETNLRGLKPGPDGKTAALDCRTCHQLDAQRHYFLPVSYDKHCQECHPLTVQMRGDFADGPLRQAALAFGHQPAPHKEPAVVRSSLVERLTQFVGANPGVLEVQPPPPLKRPLPGRRPVSAEALVQESWVDEQLQFVGRQLFDGAGGCRFCHQVSQARGPAGLPVYAPSAVPQRWLQHGRFYHDSHRQLLCTECHGGTPTSTASADVLLPRIESCKQCHGPSGQAGAACVDCHGYHDWKQDTFRGELTISKFLKRQ